MRNTMQWNVLYGFNSSLRSSGKPALGDQLQLQLQPQLQQGGGRTGELNLFMFYLKQSQKGIFFSIHQLTTAICDEEAKDILILETLITKFAMITINTLKKLIVVNFNC